MPVVLKFFVVAIVFLIYFQIVFDIVHFSLNPALSRPRITTLYLAIRLIPLRTGKNREWKRMRTRGQSSVDVLPRQSAAGR